MVSANNGIFSNSNFNTHVEKSMDGLTNSSQDLEHFHDGKIAKGL